MGELISTWAKTGSPPLAASTWRVTLTEPAIVKVPPDPNEISSPDTPWREVERTTVEVEACDVAHPDNGSLVFVDRKGRLIKLFVAGQYKRVDLLSAPELGTAW